MCAWKPSAVNVDCRSKERVQQRSTNPLLKSGLITETVASKMVAQITCKDYLRMEDSAVTQMFTALGVARNSIVYDCLPVE